VAWVIIQPLFAMLIFTLFFGILAKIPTDGVPYPLFYYSALLPWTYFANALQTATNMIVDQRHLITKVYFPRILLPLSAVVSGLVDFGIAFVILVALMAFYGVAPGLAVATVPLFLLFATATALGVGLWLSALNARFRDVRYATPFLIQLWLFASPVAYPSSLVPESWRWLYGLNPMAGVIEGFRWALLGQGRPPDLLVPSITVVVAVLLAGLLYFRQVEGTIADVV
jgi:lipopolysaccharide transport system permease protein